MRKSLPARNRSRSRRKVVSLNVSEFIKKQFPTKVPISMITGISKLYCKNNPTTQDSKILKRFSQSTTHLNTARFIDYLSTNTEFKNGAQLNDETVKKIYQGSCNPEGKMTFQYLMKLGEQSGFKINEKLAKAIVKKYGKRKEFMNLQDCQKVIKKKYQNTDLKASPNQSPRQQKQRGK